MSDDPPTVDSVVVTQTVRAILPFVLTFGLFTMLHGTSSVGGGFQGGVVVGAAVVAVGFAFGLGQTRRAVGLRGLTVGSAAGLVVFAAVALASLALDGAFLDARAYARLPLEKATVYAVEIAEVGIGITVASVVSLLFLELGRDER
ncbi:MnhB domain-containing protein [Halosimplex amylolyticum]|uniref:MnhB domain-containing protein n=1 Tax=Halosimplex amylolyticum TaxID=3396616 RepID=UPI003F5577A4